VAEKVSVDWPLVAALTVRGYMIFVFLDQREPNGLHRSPCVIGMLRQVGIAGQSGTPTAVERADGRCLGAGRRTAADFTARAAVCL